MQERSDAASIGVNEGITLIKLLAEPGVCSMAKMGTKMRTEVYQGDSCVKYVIIYTNDE